MHKGVILLVKADSRIDALNDAKSFLEDFYEEVYDWYVIGGRWSGNLNDATKKFYEEAEKIFSKEYPTEKFISVKMVEEQKDNLQSTWEKLGGKLTNPYNRNRYEIEGYNDDCLPLSECLSSVKNWGSRSISNVDEFSFDSKVYDTINLTNNPKQALKNPESLWAVQIDMHY